MGSYSNLPWSGCLQQVDGDESTSRASCKGSLTIDGACKNHLVDLILADFCLESVVGVSRGVWGLFKKILAIFCSKIEGLEMEYVLCLYC